jgi:hypothetical protein
VIRPFPAVAGRARVGGRQRAGGCHARHRVIVGRPLGQEGPGDPRDRDPNQSAGLDLDHSGTDSLGDEVVFNSVFSVGDTKVGTDGGVCKLVRVPAIYHCIATNSFAKGDLTVQFLADFNQTAPGHFAITAPGPIAARAARSRTSRIGRPDAPT